MQRISREYHSFIVEESESGTLLSMKNREDFYEMNWITEGEQWGEMLLPEGLCGEVRREACENGRMKERFVIKNCRETDYFGQNTSISIGVPLPDRYTSAEVCMKERCHVHLWCGGSSAWVCAVRMGGEAPHLGLILKQGSISGYSITRDEQAVSNDRGIFWLHPDVAHLLPGEAAEISWELFWFSGQEEFTELLNQEENFLNVRMDRTVYFEGEELELTASHFPDSRKGIVFAGSTAAAWSITENRNPVCYSLKSQKGLEAVAIRENGVSTGIQEWIFERGVQKTLARTLVLPAPDKLAEKRCRFIAEKQQLHSPKSRLDGAFLIYDNEEKCLYYDAVYDHNGGRERVGMGVLLAAYLQQHSDGTIERALQKFTQYVYRELYDPKTGIVYNDAGRDNTWHRLYNYPWMALFFMERFHLYREEQDLLEMYRIICTYYEQGGVKFYAIGIPMRESVELLRENGQKQRAETLLSLFREHGDLIADTGLNYPPHEVNYEQSIVAPAVIYMMQLYQLTGDEKYLRAGREQLAVLELFNGRQPDYHMFETAIRHWDGFWFGKYRNYGDTFPHYWSALSGLAFWEYGRITKDEKYLNRAENSLRGVLSLFFPDGSASCACVRPEQVNGKICNYMDPWANDQDWGLYYYLKYGQLLSGKEEK